MPQQRRAPRPSRARGARLPGHDPYRGLHRSVGRGEFNRSLSEARAAAVRDAFIARGVAAERLRRAGLRSASHRSPTTPPKPAGPEPPHRVPRRCLPTDGDDRMGFLLAKILLLLGVAAACGAAFAYWWFRRHYEDVSPPVRAVARGMGDLAGAFRGTSRSTSRGRFAATLARCRIWMGRCAISTWRSPTSRRWRHGRDIERRQRNADPESATAAAGALSQRLDSLEAACAPW